ncbi:MAG: FHA domain-containing protein [Planctomycetota bacterium]
MLILIVAGGPDKGRIYELHEGREVVLGRDEADLQFSDPKVSRRHARLWSDGGRWYLQDLESKHGTHRNQSPVEGLQPLKDGDYLQIGRTVMVLARATADNLEHPHAALAAQAPAKRRGFRDPRLLIAGAVAAAGVFLTLNLVSLHTAAQDRRSVAAELASLRSAETPTQKKLRDQVRLALDTKRDHELRIETMIAAFGPQTDRMIPKLDAILATLDGQPDLVAPLTALADAVEARGDTRELTQKIDTALALLEARGGDAQALARDFRDLLAQRPSADDIAAAALAHRSADGLRETQAVLDAIADIRTALPTAEHFNTVTAQLTNLADALGDRRDTDLIHTQLAALIESVKGQTQADAERALADAQADPFLGQILDQVQALAAAQTQRDAQLDTVIASLKQQPYDNRAMLDEALAQFDPQATDLKVARILDDTMAELRGKAITDADHLRRLIQREVVAAVTRADRPADSPRLAATDPRSRRDTRNPARLTRTETAYKLAFESGKKITIGVVPERPGSGRTLDPAAAIAAGHESWRDWYLMDDLESRMKIADQAQRVAARQAGSATVLTMPRPDADPQTSAEPKVNVLTSPAQD